MIFQKTIFTTPEPSDSKQRYRMPQIVKIDTNSLDKQSNKIDSSAVKEGRKEFIKEIIKQRQTNRQKLHELQIKAERKLLHIKTVFPFTFFPDEVIIDENQISIVNRMFFLSEDIRSVPIKNVANVIVETSIFFATLRVFDKFFREIPLTVTFLRKHEAIRARRIIQGLVVANEEGIDLMQFSVPELVNTIETLGKAQDRQ